MQIPTFPDVYDTGKQSLGFGARQSLSGWSGLRIVYLFESVFPAVNQEECNKQNQSTTTTKKLPLRLLFGFGSSHAVGPCQGPEHACTASLRAVVSTHCTFVLQREKWAIVVSLKMSPGP